MNKQSRLILFANNVVSDSVLSVIVVLFVMHKLTSTTLRQSPKPGEMHGWHNLCITSYAQPVAINFPDHAAKESQVETEVTVNFTSFAYTQVIIVTSMRG